MHHKIVGHPKFYGYCSFHFMINDFFLLIWSTCAQEERGNKKNKNIRNSGFHLKTQIRETVLSFRQTTPEKERCRFPLAPLYTRPVYLNLAMCCVSQEKTDKPSKFSSEYTNFQRKLSLFINFRKFFKLIFSIPPDKIKFKKLKFLNSCEKIKIVCTKLELEMRPILILCFF